MTHTVVSFTIPTDSPPGMGRNDPSDYLSFEDVKAVARKRNILASRALLLKLRRVHYDQAPVEYKNRCLPIIWKADPLIALGKQAFEREAARISYARCDTKSKIAAILEVVARYYNIEVSRMLCPRSTANLVRPRQVAMYLATELTDVSFPAIGKELQRDHSTVIYGHRMIGERMKADPVLAIQIETLMEQLKHWKRPTEHDRRAYESSDWTPAKIEELVALRPATKWVDIANRFGKTVSCCQHHYKKALAAVVQFEQMAG